MPFKTGKKILETHLNTSRANQKTWKRVRKLTEILEIPIPEAQKTLRTLPENAKKSLDTLEIPPRRFQNPRQAHRAYQEAIRNIKKNLRRPSKGDPKRSVRAGAPNEYIQETQQPPLVTLRTLKKLKETCKKHFGGDWNLLEQSAKALKELLAGLE